MTLSRRALIAALAAGFGTGSRTALAADYPSKPITIVVPFSAGSATDIIARIVGEQFDKSFNQVGIVDNRAGAGGTLGAASVAAAEPDGYTLLVHSAGHVANATLYPKLKYDTVEDFVAVSMIAAIPNVIVVPASSGIKTIQELVQRGKAKPGSLTHGSAGNGSASHIGAERFRISAGFESLHVPYRGANPALTDLLGGRFDWLVAPVGLVYSHIQKGQLVPLAVETRQRTAFLPEVPTTIEAGYKDSDYNFWIGMFAPRKTPPKIVSKLHSSINAALNSPDVRAKFKDVGAEVFSISQKQFANQVKTEAAEMAALIRKHGIRAD